MVSLEKLSKGAIVRGLLVDAPATIVDAQWIGANVVEAFFKGPSGKVENRLLYREDENSLELVETGSYWAFDSDGTLFRLASEAQRIQLAAEAYTAAIYVVTAAGCAINLAGRTSQDSIQSVAGQIEIREVEQVIETGAWLHRDALTQFVRPGNF